MGRPRKPTRQQISEGDPRKIGKHKLQERLDAEPKPTPGIPERPEWLDAEGKRMWDRLAVELDRLGLLTQIDGPALAGACAAFALAVRCRKVLKREGLTVAVGENGYIQARPEVGIEARAWQQYRAFCTEFGLTPAARSRLATEKESSSTDDLIALLSKPRPKKEPKGDLIQ